MKFTRKDLATIVERASTISERLGPNFLLDEVQENDAIINSRLEQWCQVVAQGNWEKFEQRLAWDAIDLNTVHSILGSVHMSDVQQLPAWVETLNECLKATVEFTLETLEKETIGKNRFLDTQEPLPFQEVLLPFIYVARQKLIAQTDSRYNLLSEESHANLELSLLGLLSRLCSPSMELEFSVFRTIHSTATQRLGKSANAHSKKYYRDFIKGLLEGELLAFFWEYPVLARLVATATDVWIDAIKEFLSRLASDLSEIQRTFQHETELGQVVTVDPDLSDRHHNGRSVMAITFASGLKVIYKPKNLSLEVTYFHLLAWLNEQGAPLPFNLLKIINHSTHGWVEFVEALPCKDKEEAKRYYQRTGVLMCFVHILQATDLHLENIIACGEHPILIDLETLMHPWVQKVEDLEDAKKALHLASQELGHSVLRTGLLPRWEFNLENQGYDLSGLGGFGQQKTFFRLPTWHNINTDAMVLKYENEEIGQRQNMPFLEGGNLSLPDYVEDIVDGFRRMYRFMIEHRQALMGLDSPLTDLMHQQVRYIFRSTKIYKFILETTLAPKFLRNGADRSIELDILSRVMFLSGSQRHFWNLVKVEQQALEQIDIPLFVASSDTKILQISSNQIIDFFTEPSFSQVVKCLNQLNNEDLEKQIVFIKGSLYSRITSDAHYSLQIDRSTFNFGTVDPLARQEIVQQTIAISTDLQKQAICSADGSTTWISPQYILEVQRFQLQPHGASLYDGSCGMALFLAALKKVTTGSEFLDLALTALQPLHQDLQGSVSDRIAREIGIGGGVGCGSLIYALVRISQFLEEPALLDDARKVASLIMADLITSDQKFDIIWGSAGAILGLLALQTRSTQQDVLEKAIACGHHLLEHLVASDSGNRSLASLDGKLLTGFSHGAAGIAYSLLRLYKASGETAFLEAAEEAIAYERSVFIPELNNWPDFRQPQTKDNPKCMCSWCHGAPGIGLARVATLDILDTPEIRQDIEAAITTTLNYGLSDIDHLCCGNMGRVEFLFTAGRKLNRPELVEAAMKLASSVVARANQKGHFGYGPILTFHPGFFQGTSGIGYQLLRLAYPDQLPSVLLWE